ncbi:hypothetical protein [Chryseobacterium sp. JK1]|uniref:hypothetical protein n=1 Tax=Chryseobacterium sp. JK1 TaxID=874294 RepID=UPI003D683A5D
MNEDYYKIYNYRGCPAEKAGHSIKEGFEFFFKSTKSNLKYCIEAIYHEGDFFAIKYYCKIHRDSKRKYSIPTNTHEPYKIIRSCIQIMPILQKKYPTASFVAVGARSISGDTIENAQNTIRFRLYYKMVYQMFNQYEDFILMQLPEVSGIGIVFVNDIYSDPQKTLSPTKHIVERVGKIKKIVQESYDEIHIQDEE